MLDRLPWPWLSATWINGAGGSKLDALAGVCRCSRFIAAACRAADTAAYSLDASSTSSIEVAASQLAPPAQQQVSRLVATIARRRRRPPRGRLPCEHRHDCGHAVDAATSSAPRAGTGGMVEEVSREEDSIFT